MLWMEDVIRILIFDCLKPYFAILFSAHNLITVKDYRKALQTDRTYLSIMDFGGDRLS